MKRKALIINYMTFFVLLLTLLFTSSQMLELGKYLLLILGGVMLYRITSVDYSVRAFHLFNFLYIGFVVSFVLYASLYRSALFNNIILYLLVATVLGFVLSLAYVEPRRGEVQKKLPPRVVPAKKEEKKPAIIRPVKKTASKKTATKKKSAKKKSAKKKTAKKKTAKKATKKTAKKKVAKKAPAKKTRGNKVAGAQKRKVSRESAKKKVAKKSARKKVAKKKR